MEFNLTGDVWRHFQILSNELNTPKVLVCPKDNRQKVTNWQSFTNNSHLSYFAGLDADETKPQTILSGDRNVTSPTVRPVKGLLNITTNDRVEWTKTIHNLAGNIGLADASIVVLANRYDTDRVLTLDERHFRALRTLDGKPFTLLPADA